MNAQEQAALLYSEFVLWQERQNYQDHKRVISILAAWGIRVGEA